MLPSKFHPRCSCVICREEITIQNLGRHHESKHTTKVLTKRCVNCDCLIPDYKTFCSISCSATYTNKRKDYTKFKPGPPKGYKNPKYNRPPHTRVKQCVICSKWHPNKGKTCSVGCKSALLSFSIKRAISEGFKPNNNRGRGKKSWLEKSFEEWLLLEFPSVHYITEHPFSRKDIVKTYFADFYFPHLNLIIELDGSQHNNSKEYDSERDSYISTTYGLTIIRISHLEYRKKTKIGLVRELLKA